MNGFCVQYLLNAGIGALIEYEGQAQGQHRTISFMKPLKKQSINNTKYLLANFNGVEVHLKVPDETAREQKYYLEYTNEVRKKFYGKGTVKAKALNFFNSIVGQDLKRPMIVAMLTTLLHEELEVIQQELLNVICDSSLTARSLIIDVLKAFYAYKELQYKDGTVSRGSLYGYKHHQRKLEGYFNLPKNRMLTLDDLNSTLWLNYRVELVDDVHQFGKGRLKNSSVNQHFQYIHQLYSWLIDYVELPIKNHLKKLSKLSEAKGDKRFKVIDDTTLNEFYTILETHEKYYFTRLYLSALFLYENNVRLSEQVLIQVKDIDFEASTVRIINNKGSRTRLIKVSPKVKELIELIRDKTIRHGIEITDEMYLIGGHDMFKSGIPHGHKELAVVMRRFRKKYPQFAGRTLYEHKHTSITKQFNSGIDHYQIKQRADHSSIKTTEIYLEQSKVVNPFELKLDD